jgi:hypothetical protein
MIYPFNVRRSLNLMAVHLNLYPYDCGANPCYLFLLDSFTQDGLTQWPRQYLIESFGKVHIDALIDYQFLKEQRNQMLGLGFNFPGSTLDIIIEILRSEICSFTELLLYIPKHIKCSSNRLRNFLIFLINFNIAQVYPCPNSGMTWCCAADVPELEKDLDWIYQLSDDFELKYVYPLDTFEGAEDLRALMSSSSGKLPD